MEIEGKLADAQVIDVTKLPKAVKSFSASRWI